MIKTCQVGGQRPPAYLQRIITISSFTHLFVAEKAQRKRALTALVVAQRHRVGHIVDHLLQVEAGAHVVLLHLVLAAEYEEVVAVGGDPENDSNNNKTK